MFRQHKMSSFKIYIITSNDFVPNEYRAKCTEILNEDKLEKHLERNYKNVKIIHLTDAIPITKKSSADKRLKETIHTDSKKTYNGRCIIDKAALIKLVDSIAKLCIKEEECRKKKEEEEKNRFKQQSDQMKQMSYYNDICSESDEPNQSDIDFIDDADDDDDDVSDNDLANFSFCNV